MRMVYVVTMRDSGVIGVYSNMKAAYAMAVRQMGDSPSIQNQATSYRDFRETLFARFTDSIGSEGTIEGLYLESKLTRV